MIGIIDYGAGNLHSVKKSLDYLGLPARIVHAPSDLADADGMILPGVGHFQSAVRQLQKSGLLHFIQEWLFAGRPFLGICLGMQMLFETSEEGGGANRGFASFPGRVVRFTGGKNLHMGWNRVDLLKPSPLFLGLESGSYFYYVHRYFAVSADRECEIAESRFTRTFPAAVAKGNICGVQFHPEKSGAAGLRLLENWGKTC